MHSSYKPWQHPDLTEAIELALQFAQFVRQRQPDKLDPG